MYRAVRDDPTLIRQVKAGTFKPPPATQRQVRSRTGKKRTIYVPHPLVLSIERAIAETLAGLLGASISSCVVGCPRGGKPSDGVHHALMRVLEWLHSCGGRCCVWQGDVQQAYRRIQPARARDAVERRLRERRPIRVILAPTLRALVDSLLGAGSITPRDGVLHPGEGLPTGGGLAPIMMGIYLGPVDDALGEFAERCGCLYLRFADDLLLLAPTREVAMQADEIAREQLQALDLDLNPSKTKITAPDHTWTYLSHDVIPGVQPRLRVPAATRDQWVARVCMWRSTSKGLESLEQRIAGWHDFYKLALHDYPADAVAIYLRIGRRLRHQRGGQHQRSNRKRKRH